jgi:hypothetical protein
MAGMAAPRDPRAGAEPITDRSDEGARGSTSWHELEHPVQPLRTGGTGRPLTVLGLIVATVAILVWQPWGKGSPAVLQAPVSRASAIAVGPGPVSASPGLVPTATPVPSSPRADLGVLASQPYVSLIDNEWTVVALISADGPISTEEPSIQHGRGSWSPGDALLVLQQGLDYATRPLESPKARDAACLAPNDPRLRQAVHLPVGRVAYLGVTFPGMDPRARVTASILDRTGIALSRVKAPAVRIRGLIEGRTYVVPSSGSGGAVLFSFDPPSLLPSAAYRFDVVAPGIPGHRYLYACVGS